MLLTIFYAAATWMQSRRLGSLRSKINQFANSQSSVVFYKIPDGKSDSEDELLAFTTCSLFCKNKDKAMIGEVLHFDTNTRSCVILPQQIINVDNWITMTDDSPLPIKFSRKVVNLKYPRLFLLVETNCLKNLNFHNVHYYNLSQFGIPRAWRADENLGLLIESDIDHFTKLSSLFLACPIFVDLGFEINRIQTVAVEGKPCLIFKDKKELLKSSSFESQNFSSIAHDSEINGWSSRQLSLQAPSNYWRNQMDLLRSFSQCATQTSRDSSVVRTEDETASVAIGNAGLKPTDTSETVEEKITEKKILNKENSPINERSNEIRIKSASTAALTSDTAPKFSRENSIVISTQSTPSKHDFQTRKNTFSSLYSLGSASTLSIRSASSGKSKPPNVLIYAESPTTIENIKTVLNETLHKHKYTIYSITEAQLFSGVWVANCFLLVLFGNVSQQVEPLLTSYLLQGGKLFCLCSSFLHTLLPTFRTAEVRERELVHFSYGRWQRVRLMHHVFCYQNSPSRTKFSGDSDEMSIEKDRISPVPQTPSSVEVIDKNGVSHTLHVKVLGVEETWQTPSLLLAYFSSPGGCAVFSQVHLELDPSQSMDEEDEEELQNSALTRKEIIKDILSNHLGMEIGAGGESTMYTLAYFLGMHETKLNFLEKTKHLQQDGILKLETLGLKFCKKGETPPQATASLLPVLIHSCPRDFSTLDYFENLGTRALGRLLIYSEILGSSMDVVNGELAHGLAVVPSQQTSGKGRTSNQWLSPPGCAMFSLQIHFSSDSYMGRHPSVLQHMVSTAIALSLSEMGPDYAKAFDIRLKWPNDLYTNASVKIGGLLVTCFTAKNNIICNIGCGINLDNDIPTTCLNKIIEEYNKANNSKLKKLSREKLFAIIFTQLERILDKIEEGDIQYAENLYYKYWLHGGTEVKVLDSTGLVRQATIMGIDEFGFLKVRESSGNTFTVHPDGNSFDMMEGLIAPKLK